MFCGVCSLKMFTCTDLVTRICTTFNTYLKLSDFVIRPRLFLEFAAAISVRICKDTVSPLLFQKLRSGKTKPTFLLPSLGATTISQGDIRSSADIEAGSALRS